MSNDRRNVRFPRCGARFPPSARPEMFRAVTLWCLVPQETPVQEQMEASVDQLLAKVAVGSEVMVFLKASSAD